MHQLTLNQSHQRIFVRQHHQAHFMVLDAMCKYSDNLCTCQGCTSPASDLLLSGGRVCRTGNILIATCTHTSP